MTSSAHDSTTRPGASGGPPTGPDHGCGGCAEGRRAESAALSRRHLLLAAALGAGAVVADTALSGSATQYAFAGTGYRGDTIVVLSLRGGFDGLSAVVPVGDPDYARLRPTIGIPASRVGHAGGIFGLHPALAPLQKLWSAGRLAAVHAVGQSNPTRSHFAAMQEMEDAAPGSNLRTGWIDRMVGLNTATTFSAAAVGSGNTPTSMLGPHPELTIRTLDNVALAGTKDAGDAARWGDALNKMSAPGPLVLRQASSTAHLALGAAAKVLAHPYSPAHGAHYPTGTLGDSLREVARLIKAKVGLRVATVDQGNWDMHVNMGRSDKGWMVNQLTEFAAALLAFAIDLGDGLNGVTLVTLSEFGRRAAENGSGGVDHGHGNVSFVLGGGVHGGQVYGRWPGLATSDLDHGDLAVTTDYRTLLAEILEKRGGLAVGSVFPGLDRSRLGMFAAH